MSWNSSQAFLDPTPEAVAALLARRIEGPVAMLNLLRIRERADYSASPDLAPPSPISGREAYERYVRHTLPFLRESGGELTYLGEGGPFLVGPPGYGWDLAMLVRQDSVASFLSFASNAAYLAGIGHRTAAVSDSRILPLIDVAV
jgi:hypothetical protein